MTLKNLNNNTKRIIMRKGGAILKSTSSSMQKLHNNKNLSKTYKYTKYKTKRATNLKNNIREKIHNACETKKIY